MLRTNERNRMKWNKKWKKTLRSNQHFSLSDTFFFLRTRTYRSCFFGTIRNRFWGKCFKEKLALTSLFNRRLREMHFNWFPSKNSCSSRYKIHYRLAGHVLWIFLPHISLSLFYSAHLLFFSRTILFFFFNN